MVATAILPKTSTPAVSRKISFRLRAVSEPPQITTRFTPRTQRVHIDEPHDISIMRPGKWGNPYKIGRDGDRAAVIAKHKAHVASSPHLLAQIPELSGLRIGCCCGPDEACHGDFLCLLADIL